MTGEHDLVDEPLLAGERLLVVNRTSAVVSGRQVAHLLTLRDRTELSGALRELDSQRSLTATLRAQAHEFSNHLHVVQGLLELGRGQDASEFIDRIGGGGDLPSGGGSSPVRDPAVAALLLAKSAVARERGCQVRLDPASSLPELPGGDDDLLTVLGNLVDNAVDAAGQGGTVVVFVGPAGPGATADDAADLADDHDLLVRVDDDGPGVPPQDRDRVFTVGVSTKGGRGQDGQAQHGRGIGLALVARVASRRGGSAAVQDSPLGGARVVVRWPAPAVRPVPLPTAGGTRP